MANSRKGLAFDIEARDRFSRAFASLNGKLGKMSKTLKVAKVGLAGIAAAGLALGAALGRQALKMQQVADQVGNLSQRLGASTEALSQYRFVADAADVSFETFAMGLQRMTRRIAEAANGSGEAKDALLELGLSAQRMKSLKPEDQFELLADRLAAIKDPADRVRLAMKLFDSEGVALLQMMGKGGDGMRAMRAEADRLGLTMSEEMVEAAQLSSLEMKRLTHAFDGVGVKLLNFVAPALTEFATWLNEVLPDALSSGTDLLYGIQRSTLLVSRSILSTMANLANKLSRLPDMPFADKYREIFFQLSEAVLHFEWALVSLDDEKQKSIARDKELADSLRITIPGMYDASSAALAASSGMEALAGSMNLLEESMTLDAFEAFEKDAARIFDSVVTPLEKYQAEIENLNNHLAAGSISQDTYARAVTASQKAFEDADPAIQKAKQRADEFGQAFARNMTLSSMQGKKFGEVIKNIGLDIADLLIQMAITRPLAGAISAGFSSLFAGFAFAGGGVMSGAGPLPLKRYASGGIASTPQLAMFGEGTRPEAYVPLPDGRSIPVTMSGGGGGGAPTYIYNIDARGAEIGVEDRIRAVLRQEEPRIVSRSVRESVDAVASRADQGGSFARSVGRR